jgi:hypothetical protein
MYASMVHDQEEFMMANQTWIDETQGRRKNEANE